MRITMKQHSLFISNFKIIFKIILIITILLIFLFGIVMPRFDNTYQAAIHDKIARLKSIEGSKIVLAGDSTTAFGNNSKIIEEAFGMPVVNMGLHAGMGSTLSLKLATLNIQPGDIYILSSMYYNSATVNPSVIWATFENHFDLYTLLTKEDIIPMIKALPRYLKICLDLYASDRKYIFSTSEEAKVYSRNSFNEYGDVSTKRTNIFNENLYALPIDVSIKCLENINEINKIITEKGATLVVAVPAIPIGEQFEPLERYLIIQNTLKQHLNCPIIADFSNYLLEQKYFYDNPWHLTDEGAKVRTELLINDLRKWINNNNQKENVD